MTDKKDLLDSTKDSVENVESPERREFLTQSLKAGPAVYAGSRLPFFAAAVLTAKQAWAQLVPFGYWKKRASNSPQVGFAWGQNTYGKLGDVTATNRSSPVQILPAASWSTLGGGASNSVGIKNDSTLFLWGYNSFGQIGNNTSGATNYSSPMQVGGSWSSVVVNNNYTLGIRSDKTLWAWGSNSFGQIGTDNYTDYSSPVQVSTSLSFRMVAPGRDSSAAIDFDSRLWVWGRNTSAELGQNSFQGQMNLVGASWTELAGGRNHLLAERFGVADNLFTWGDSTFGQLGLGDTVNNTYMSPTAVAGKSIISIASGGDHALAVSADGKLWAWGQNSFGQLGTGDTSDRSSPVQVMIGTSFAKVGAGKDFSFAIDTTGKLWSAGNNSFGQCGWVDGVVPTMIDGSWSAVAVGGQTNNYGQSLRILAIKANDKSLWAWGDNGTGQMGVGDTVMRSSPTQISALSWSQVYANADSMYARRADGSWFCWGHNGKGELGLGTGDVSHRSVIMQMPVSFVSMSLGDSHCVGVMSDGSAYYWGISEYGQSTKVSFYSPNVVSAGAGLSWVMGTGGYWGCQAGIKSDGTLYTWGQNGNFNLGVGDNNPRFSPTKLAGSWISVALGRLGGAGIQSTSTSGTLWTWGYNTASSNGSGANRNAPFQIGTASNWKKVAYGAQTGVALNTLGELWVWGTNIAGGVGLGTGDTNGRTSPDLIPGTKNWADVVAGWEFFLGIKSDGSLWSWGYNSHGQLGTGDILFRTSPVQIAVGTSFAAVYAGRQNAFARTTDNRMFVWGSNLNGCLGLGDTNWRSAPQQLAGSWIYASSNRWYQTGQANAASLFVKSDGSLWVVGNIQGATSTFGVGNGVLNGSNNVSMLQQVCPGTSFVQCEVSFQAFQAIATDGRMFTWGSHIYGETGTGYIDGSPTQIDGSWISISAAEHMLGIKSDYTVWSWGNNVYGQLGHGDTINRFSPTQITSLPAASYVQACAYAYTAASGYNNGWSAVVRNDGQVLTWGHNSFGQLGTSDNAFRSAPVATAIYTGYSTFMLCNHAVGLKTNGTLWLLGSNSIGMLGTGDNIFRSSPIQQPGSWVSYYAGRAGTAAINNQGQLFVWGGANLNHIGKPTYPYSWNSVSSLASWAVVVGGDAHAIGRDLSNNVYTWGLNSSGQAGRPDKAIKSAPLLLGAGIAVGANSLASYFIKTNNQLWVTGSNSFGQLGTSNTTHYSSPMQVGGSWNSLGSGPTANHMYATQSDNSLWAWGLNNQYQLGTYPSTNQSSPVNTVNGSGLSFTQMVMTSSAGAALQSNGALWTMGENSRGVSGLGFSNLVPGQLKGSWSTVACGFNFMAGIQTDGTLWLWGNNGSGRLGVGDTTLRSSPTQVSGGGSWTYVACGTSSVYAKKSNGTWWVWGTNSNGELGLNSGTGSFSTPQALAVSYTAIYARGSSVIGYDSTTKKAYVFGSNSNGELGLGDIVNRSSPVQLPGQWSLVTAGENHLLGLKT